MASVLRAEISRIWFRSSWPRVARWRASAIWALRRARAICAVVDSRNRRCSSPKWPGSGWMRVRTPASAGPLEIGAERAERAFSPWEGARCQRGSVFTSATMPAILWWTTQLARPFSRMISASRFSTAMFAASREKRPRRGRARAWRRDSTRPRRRGPRSEGSREGRSWTGPRSSAGGPQERGEEGARDEERACVDDRQHDDQES